MKRVVLDTNVIVSGTFWTGPSFAILELADSGKIGVITSLPIIREYQDVIGRSEILDKTTQSQRKTAGDTVRKLLTKAEVVEPRHEIYAVKDDPDDNKIIETAVAGKAEYIITQDKHLLFLKNYANIQIMTPENFLKSCNE